MITSRDNRKLKFARAVRDGRERGFVFVEGARLAAEAFAANLRITEILISEDFDPAGTVPKGAAFETVSRPVFDSVADTASPQGIVVVAERPDTRNPLETLIRANSPPVTVFLHRINNPSNLGAILRTARAADAAGVVISRDSADAFSPKSLRASMGAAFGIPIWTGADFDEVIAWARGKGLRTTATDVRGGIDYRKADWAKPRLLVFGSEARGLSDQEFSAVDESIVIPMANGVESLNLAVAAGIILYRARF
jgi:TrmH family RNA methyltransferase